MSAVLLMIVTLIALLAGYIFYGKKIARKYGLDPNRPTPAHSKKDGIDYVPAKAPVLMGHHFASIAGAAPILGPIIAVVFGWIPVVLWIIVGSIFMGGVHDISSIIASIRHGGKTIGEVIEEQIGRSGKRLFLIFAWSVLVLVIATFANAVANVFVKEPSTASASFLFILVAIAFGLSIYRFKTPLLLSTVIGISLLIGCIIVGLKFPIVLQNDTWKLILFLYVFFAAVVPVWALLQPRDYLSSFLLYAILLAGVVGIFAANPTIHFPAFTSFYVDKLGFIFPILFVTVACGAISGFHALVSSGTTAKQLDKETDALPIGYGSMLIEGLLAVIALVTVITILQSDYIQGMKEGGPIGLFASGIGNFVTYLGIPFKVGVTFAALAISAFALTTLDTATRLGRFMFQEIFEDSKNAKFFSNNRYVGTLVTIGVAMSLTFTGTREALWPLFGSANQLLASLTLLAVTVWLAKSKKKNGFVKYPMFFMFAVTLTALGFQVYNNYFGATQNILLVVISLLLFAVAITLVVNAIKSLKRKPGAWV